MKSNKLKSPEIPSAQTELYSVVADIASPAEVNRFFEEILTPSEIEDLALRWLLLKKLSAGVPQRRIAADLHISLCKITRGSKILKNPQSVCGMVLRRQRSRG